MKDIITKVVFSLLIISAITTNYLNARAITVHYADEKKSITVRKRTTIADIKKYKKPE